MKFFLFSGVSGMLYLDMRKLLISLFVALTVITFGITPDILAVEKGLTKESAENALKGIIPDVKILDIRPAQVEGLWEVAIETRGQKGVVYLDSTGHYGIFGSILDLKTKTNFTQDRNSELNKVDVSQIPLDDAIVMGDKNAKYHIIVFDDPM
jgi:thiol:disulfide interchange protein DsbC